MLEFGEISATLSTTVEVSSVTVMAVVETALLLVDVGAEMLLVVVIDK